MLSRLRTATQASHARLDAAFGSLDLHEEADCARFLQAHAIALGKLHPLFSKFVDLHLGVPSPDFPALLAADLVERGARAGETLTPDPQVLDPAGRAGLVYVIAGSRLGNAVIRSQGYYGRDRAMSSRYMEDDSGHAVWKAFTAWARGRTFDEAEMAACEAVALATFTHFERAFACVAPRQEEVSHG